LVASRRNSSAAFSRVLLVLASAVSCLIAIWAAPAANAQVSPSADTFATTFTPNLNYGDLPLLAVTAGTTSYVRFDLSSIPTNSTVSKATLVLFVDAVTGDGQLEVYRLNAPWVE
jgi:hypothetical protein